MYINKSICKKCQGKCCKLSDCLLSTRNISNVEELKQLVLEKKIAIYSIPYNTFFLNVFNIGNSLHALLAIANTPDAIRVKELKRYNNVYIIKMRSKNQGVFIEINDPNKFDEQLNSGECIALTQNGCMYDDSMRPWGGLQLEPDKRGIQYCKLHYSLIDAALEWLKFHEAIDKIFEKT